MRLRVVIAVVCVASACGDAEPPTESAAAAPRSTAPPSRSVADLLVAEAEILARAGMGFQRRWLDWHLAGRPSQDPFDQRTGAISGYEPGGFDPAKVPEADRAALAELRAALAALPPAELRARYQSLIALHGNAPVDASRTGSLRITDDGEHLVFADRGEPDIAYAWRIADGRRVARVGLRTSEDPFMTRDALPSGLVWSQYTPTPAGPKLAVWDLPAGELRSSELIGERKVLAVSEDGRLAAMTSSRGIVIRAVPGGRTLATLRGSRSGTAAFSGDGQLLALVADDSRLRLFRVASGEAVRDLPVSIGDLSHLDVDRTGGRVVGSGANAVAIWDERGERVVDTGGRIDQVALSADRGLALVARGVRLELLDLATGNARWTVELPGPARAVALGARAGMAAWWTDAELVVAALADGRPLPTFAGHQSWPSEEVHREALALATLLEDLDPPMYEAGLRDPFREANALDAELSTTWLASLPRARLALLPDLVEGHRGKPLRAGSPAAAIVRAWRTGCDDWWGEEDPDYTPDRLEPVDRRNLAAIHREIARRGAASPETAPAAAEAPPVRARPCRS